jgi:hypothetical protein
MTALTALWLTLMTTLDAAHTICLGIYWKNPWVEVIGTQVFTSDSKNMAQYKSFAVTNIRYEFKNNGYTIVLDKFWLGEGKVILTREDGYYGRFDVGKTTQIKDRDYAYRCFDDDQKGWCSANSQMYHMSCRDYTLNVIG